MIEPDSIRLMLRNSSSRHSSERETALIPASRKSGEASWIRSAVRSPNRGAATSGASRKVSDAQPGPGHEAGQHRRLHVLRLDLLALDQGAGEPLEGEDRRERHEDQRDHGVAELRRADHPRQRDRGEQLSDLADDRGRSPSSARPRPRLRAASRSSARRARTPSAETNEASAPRQLAAQKAGPRGAPLLYRWRPRAIDQPWAGRPRPPPRADRDVVMILGYTSWAGAVRRGRVHPEDRLTLELIDSERVGRLLVCNPFRSLPAKLVRSAAGRASRAVPASETPPAARADCACAATIRPRSRAIERSCAAYERSVRAASERLRARSARR